MSIPKLMTLAGLALAVAALMPTSALAKAGRTDLPLMGSSSGVSCTNVQTGAFTNDSTGVATLVGRFTRHAEGSGAFTGPNTFAGTGTFTGAAANGDEFAGTFTVVGILSPVHTDTLVATFTGGSGRFADLSGTAIETFQLSPLSFDGTTSCSTTEGTFTGQISY